VNFALARRVISVIRVATEQDRSKCYE
jgi:hypothetical protein